MKSEKLINAMNDIKDEYILEAREENTKKQFSIKPFIKPISIAMACCCLVVFFFIPRNAKNSESTLYSTNQYSDGEMYYEEASGSSDALTSNKKIVVYSSLSMEVKDLDSVMNDVESAVNEYEGFIQSSSMSNYGTSRTYYVTVRVPSNQLDAFVDKVQTMGNTTYYSKSQEDITDSYNESAARLESLKEEEKRVLEFYNSAQNLDELLTVEQRLTEIQSEIYYLEQSINNMDDITTYSTLSIDITQTNTYSANGDFISRIQYAFSNGWQNFVSTITSIVEAIAYYWVFIVCIGIIGGVIWYRKKRNKFK